MAIVVKGKLTTLSSAESISNWDKIMSKIKITFSIDDVGYSLDVSLDDEHLKILKHQEIVFEGTIQGLIDIVNGDVKHHASAEYIRIFSKIITIEKEFKSKLGTWI